MKILAVFVVTFMSFQVFSTIPKFACTTKFMNYVRDGKGEKHEIVMTLKKYTPVEVIKRDEKWVHVKTYQGSGWIHSSLISEEIRCMQILEPADAPCSARREKRNAPFYYLEPFKVLEVDIGCNKVSDQWGNEIWVSNQKVWPEEGLSVGIKI
ncbi:MAG: SH3 domain-containing protein [Bacteriovoracaceae bacterium]|nr:SH3 domain-containing protein [Bacteriovoracaceae bacterium]